MQTYLANQAAIPPRAGKKTVTAELISIIAGIKNYTSSKRNQIRLTDPANLKKNIYNTLYMAYRVGGARRIIKIEKRTKFN